MSEAELIVLEGVECCGYKACEQCPYRGFKWRVTKLLEDAFTVLKRYIKKED